ncbi:WxL domain-containing protein [Lapidilactobacillus luobeiensis]|uniref:WxL domain-containing protein n=1 Tax=Lapidilactobacillus luobeiensis TaxID=2950371 RepID=UPI0021C3B0D7|nr:WxL domain-containing protein [Lapidilactobacillus luobeiensis]
MRNVIKRLIIGTFLLNLTIGPLALSHTETVAAAALAETTATTATPTNATESAEDTTIIATDPQAETDQTVVDANETVTSQDGLEEDQTTDQDKDAEITVADEAVTEEASTSDMADPTAATAVPLADPDPPAKADGYKKPDSNGINFLSVPLRKGFLIQPQELQYVREGTEINLDVQTTGIPLVPYTNVEIKINKWKWIEAANDGAGGWAKEELTAKGKNQGMSNKQEATIRFGSNFESLAVGIYYFQMSVDYGLLSSTRYSKLAKVVVLASDDPARSINVVPESKVVLPALSYGVHADLKPMTSTSIVDWKAPQDNVTYLLEQGRNNEFTVNANLISSGVNKSTADPGLSFDLLEATANDLSDAASLYVGGLRAKELPLAYATANPTQWSIDGLSKIVDSFFDSDDASAQADIAKTSTFEWRVSKANSKGVYSESTLKKSYKNVQNSSGTFKGLTPTDLNGSNILTIPANDQLIKDANSELERGYPMYLRLIITIIKPRSILAGGNITLAEIPTNNAELRVTGLPTTEVPGKLTLQQVPSFTFAPLKATTIYNGTGTDLDKMPLSTNTENRFLEIYDNRETRAAWQLTAELSDFYSDDVDETKETQIVQQPSLWLQGLPNINGGIPVINAGDLSSPILAGDGTGSGGLYAVGARLALPRNSAVTIYDQQSFTATINWTLTAGAPAVSALD